MNSNFRINLPFRRCLAGNRTGLLYAHQEPTLKACEGCYRRPPAHRHPLQLTCPQHMLFDLLDTLTECSTRCSPGSSCNTRRSLPVTQDTDGDMMQFELTRSSQFGQGLRLTCNGQVMVQAWAQLNWLHWDSQRRKLTDPSNAGSGLPVDVNVWMIKALADRAGVQWRGDQPLSGILAPPNDRMARLMVSTARSPTAARSTTHSTVAEMQVDSPATAAFFAGAPSPAQLIKRDRQQAHMHPASMNSPTRGHNLII